MWAVDAVGEPLSNVTYVVSENFVVRHNDCKAVGKCYAQCPRLTCSCALQVATKRVKHAIKSDIPSVADSVSKLVHIGKVKRRARLVSVVS